MNKPKGGKKHISTGNGKGKTEPSMPPALQVFGPLVVGSKMTELKSSKFLIILQDEVENVQLRARVGRTKPGTFTGND